MIQLERIKRQFGPQLLFEGLSFRIHPGERLGLVGPNGAGKTTLLRILAGLDEPDEGRLHHALDLRVGYLPQAVETLANDDVLAVVLGGDPEPERLERELERLGRRLQATGIEPDETERLVARYGELRERYEVLGGDRREARAKSILGGLGIGAERFDAPANELSGGWRMRVALARLLLGNPGVLLLDEPTNHLDLESIGWLERFLADFAGATVVVSHDRYFLNRTVTDVVELEAQRLTRYRGNYDEYIAEKEQRTQTLALQAKQQSKQLAKTRQLIERFRYKASKAKQMQSRLRALDKVEIISTRRESRSVRFGFPPAPRSGDIVATAEGVAKRYGDTVVYDDLNLLLRRGERVALVGPNGAGKSTLLKMLAGRVDPDDGRFELGHEVYRAYFAQHQLDELDPRATVLEELERVSPPEQRTRLRGLLGRFLFEGDAVSKKVAVLSGGERARLALARLLLRPANLLLLDEPTNHLDLRSREILEDALNEYAGSLVVISHDRYFINRVATTLLAVGGGRVERHEGDYDSWVERGGDDAPHTESDGDVREEKRPSRARESRREEAEERNRRSREQRRQQQRLAPIEREISELESREAELTAQQADPAVYRDSARSAAVGRELVEIEARLKQCYADWEALVGETES